MEIRFAGPELPPESRFPEVVQQVHSLSVKKSEIFSV